MKKKTVLVAALVLGSVSAASLFSFGAKSSRVKASTGYADLDLATVYDECPSTADSNYYKRLVADTDYPLGDGTAVNMRVSAGGSNSTPSVRNYHNENTNYYIYIKYNSTHNAVGQLGAELIFNACGGYLLSSVDLFSGYQVNDAFKIQIYDQSTQSYVDEVVDQMFAGSGQNYNYEFTKPTSSFKIVHYLHSTASHNEVAWKYTRVSYESAYSLVFDSQGGTDVAMQTYAIGSGDVTVAPANPTRPNEGPTSYTFAGWYTNPECTDGNEFVFGNELTSTTTVYAKWDSETLSGYTITYDSQGGSAVGSETVPTDGTLFTKPANPTMAHDDLYEYTFHNWYVEPECYHKFDFTATPTADVTVYAGWSKKAYKPSGYKTIDPKYKIDVWGTELASQYQALDILSRETIDTGASNPAMRITVAQNGVSNSGMKNEGNSSFLVNDATMTFQIVDPQKYFSAFRIEFYVTTYNSSSKKTITLTSGGVTQASGDSPYDSLSNSDLVLVGNCAAKPQEFTFSVGNIGATGVRLRYIYAMFGTYTAAEQALNFATAFNDNNVCGTTSTDGLNETKWAAEETAYLAMTAEAQAILTEYDGSDAEILECLERYDRVIYLHGSTYDFMGRISAGKVTPKSALQLSFFEDGGSTGMLIVVTASVLCLVSAGLFFSIKRRKHQ